MLEKQFAGVRLQIHATRQEMGEAAARDAVDCIRQLLQEKEEIHCIFAAAPSQNEFLEALGKADLPWHRIHAWHMDEYLGLPDGHPASFGVFLKRALFDRVPLGGVHLIDGNADAESECRRYGALLQQHPADITFMGIGENGHLAFNDPPVADFADPVVMKPVELDPVCRQQQVHDGCFASLDLVPRQALTVTIPWLTASSHLFCIVPSAAKRTAVEAALTGPVTTDCPASILQQRPGTRMYIDADCAGALMGEERP